VGQNGSPPTDGARAGGNARVGGEHGRRLGARTIRGQLNRVVGAFVLAVGVLLGVLVVGEVRDYRAADGISAAVGPALAAQDLIHELQRERGLTNGLLGGDGRYRDEVTTQRPRVDAAREALSQLAAHGTPAGQAAVAGALKRLDGLSDVRAEVNVGRAQRAATFTFFTDAITALDQLDFGLAQAQDPTLRQHFAALRALGDAKEAAAQERGFLNGVFAAGRFGRDEYPKFADIRGTKRAALAQFDQYATAEQRAQAQAALQSAAAERSTGYESQALAGADGRVLGVDPPSWWAAMTTLIDDLRGVQASVGADIRHRAGELRDTAAQQLVGVAGLAVLIVGAQVIIAAAGARAITRPLADLVRQAGEVASRRLPQAVAAILEGAGEPAEPAPVRLPRRAVAEIRSVAEAFDEVQQAAYALAVEQVVLRRNTTDSLANLGRRNQNLVRRQLGFISRLERDEVDPSVLSNLFELDHLATRMRRNAESLLVLVGQESPRVWSTPLAVNDVLRAAVSEVEDYRRVALRRVDDGYIAGGLAADIAHMVAELVENGLSFSPPDAEVEIFGRWVGSQYLIAVVDQGVGMTAEELARANGRLAGVKGFLVAPTRFLGHYVVGRLAQRMGIDVQLADSPVRGVTARLILPALLLSRGPLPDAGPATSPSNGAARNALSHNGVPSNGVPSNGVPSNGVPHNGVPSNGVARSRATETPTPTPTVSPVPPPASSRPQARTRNGLVKREPRSPIPVRHPAPAQPPAVRDSAALTRDDRAPEEVRSMLMAVRAGMRRGELHWTDEATNATATVRPGQNPRHASDADPPGSER